MILLVDHLMFIDETHSHESAPYRQVVYLGREKKVVGVVHDAEKGKAPDIDKRILTPEDLWL